MHPLYVATCLALLVSFCAPPEAAAEELPDFDKLWQYRDPAASEAAFLELLPKAKASGNVCYHLQLLTQIARTKGMRRKFEEAHALLDGVEKKLTDETKVARLYYLLERGRTFNSSKEKAKAIPLFESAWKLAQALKRDGLAVDAAHMMGIAVTGRDAKLAWDTKAMKYAEASKSPKAKRWLGTLYNNMGWTYHDDKDYKTALALHTKGWLWHQAKKPDSFGTRVAKWSVAKQLRMLGRATHALAMQRELLAHYDQAKKPDGYVYEEIAECLHLLGKDAEAKPWFAKAWAQLKGETWINEADPKRLPRMKRLGGVKDAAPETK